MACGYDTEQCECCTWEGIGHDVHGCWLCEECLYVGAAAEEHDDGGFDGVYDYGDPD